MSKRVVTNDLRWFFHYQIISRKQILRIWGSPDEHNSPLYPLSAEKVGLFWVVFFGLLRHIGLKISLSSALPEMEAPFVYLLALQGQPRVQRFTDSFTPRGGWTVSRPRTSTDSSENVRAGYCSASQRPNQFSWQSWPPSSWSAATGPLLVSRPVACTLVPFAAAGWSEWP